MGKKKNRKKNKLKYSKDVLHTLSIIRERGRRLIYTG